MISILPACGIVLLILANTLQGYVIIKNSFGFGRRFSTKFGYNLAVTSNDIDEFIKEHALSSGIPSKLLVHWKGEDVEGYSLPFRHAEFQGAIEAVTTSNFYTTKSVEKQSIHFEDALSYRGATELSPLKRNAYNEAMQFIVTEGYSFDDCIHAAKRCSLVHDLYLIVTNTNSNTYDDDKQKYEKLAQTAIENASFDDLMEGNENEHASWCLRVRTFGNKDDPGKERRYGARARSISQEREALTALKPLLLKFKGRVNLDFPDCKIYIFDGLKGDATVLARRIASGPRVSIMNPNTRICVTNTPLCPIAAFSLCNIASIRPNQTILDPFAGSCATLLAAAMIEPSCRSVAIEIAHNGIVNRNDIRNDFSTRGLHEPVSLLQGDFNDIETRAQARLAIGDEPFDVIITDPPYGIRESKNGMENRPIDGLLQAIADDRSSGAPLLQKDGRLVVFLPCRTQEESIEDFMPTTEQMEMAGLEFELMREQPLNDCLSRWLVSFKCVI